MGHIRGIVTLLLWFLRINFPPGELRDLAWVTHKYSWSRSAKCLCRRMFCRVIISLNLRITSWHQNSLNKNSYQTLWTFGWRAKKFPQLGTSHKVLPRCLDVKPSHTETILFLSLQLLLIKYWLSRKAVDASSQSVHHPSARMYIWNWTFFVWW